jgi:hypothetical protein
MLVGIVHWWPTPTCVGNVYVVDTTYLIIVGKKNLKIHEEVIASVNPRSK